MSDMDKDLDNIEDVDLNDDSVDMDEFDNLSSFVDVDDVESLGDLGDFTDLGDLESLGDLSDLNELDELDDLDSLDDLPDIPDMEEMDDQISEADIPLPVDIEDTSDIAEREMASTENVTEPAREQLEDLIPDNDMMNTISEDTKSARSEESNNDETSVDGDNMDAMLDGILDDLDAAGVGDEDSSLMPSDEENGDDMEDLWDMLGGDENEVNDVDAPSVDEMSEGENQQDKDELEEIFALSGESFYNNLDESSEYEQDDGEEDGQELIPEGAKPKKVGFFKRIFGNIVTDEIAEKELADKAAAEEQEKAKKEQAAKDKEEALATKAAKKEDKEAKKQAAAEEKELKKADKAEQKAAKKAQKEEEAALEVTGKLNKVGVSIVLILAAVFLATEITGTQLFNYQITKRDANRYFSMKKYEKAYREVLGTNLKKKDPDTYNKIITVMKVQRSLDSYTNYDAMGYYPDALNALLQGLKKYDVNMDTAIDLEVEDDLNGCKSQIVALLNEEFGLSESEAYDILALGQEEYTQKVVDMAAK